MKKKKIELRIFWVVGIVAIVVIGLYFNGKINRYNLYKNKSSSKVISSGKFLARTTVFYLNDGLKIYSSRLKKIDIEIGDSIVKDSNSWLFEVYKKDISGKYRFDRAYDYEDVE